jgi:hypothetical protein
MLGLGVCLPLACAYSPIWTVDGWDVDRLAEAGITVESWKHPQVGEDPPLNWVRVAYDSSKLQADQHVLMTLWVTAPDGQTICTCRAERTQGSASTLTLLFAVRQENIDTARIEILVPDLLAAAAGRDFGNPGFAGYSLRLPRILALSRLPAAGQAQGDTAQELTDPPRGSLETPVKIDFAKPGSPLAPISLQSGQMIEPPFCCPPLALRDERGVLVQEFDVTGGAQRVVAPAGTYALVGHDPGGGEHVVRIEVTGD